jgi:Zn-dependent M28 family amino/carboxypeptidase
VRPTFGRDFFLLPGASPTTDALLVFAGTAEPGRQLAGSDVANKVVAFFIPGAAPDDNWGAAASATVQSGLAANAAAVILILDPQFESATIAQMAAQLGAQRLPKMVVGLRYEVAREIFRNGGADLDQLRSGAVRRSMNGTTVSIRANSTVVRPPNVIAMLPGSDPALEDTYVVVSAHIDHVGVGRPDATGDSIYNGADDDASGTSAVIEVAQAFASLPVKPARSIIFLGVSGEEKGLFGSQYFAKHPPVPAEKIVANINIDMVGRNAKDTIVAIGQDYTSLGKTAQEVARRHPELGLVVAPDPWPQENLFVRSDHFSFAQIGVPPIFFTSGLHEQYHEPSDEVELIDTDKLARVARLVFYLGHAIASDANAPTWTAAGREVVRRAGGG